MRTDHVRLAVAGLALLYSMNALAGAEPSSKKKLKYIATEIAPPLDASCADGFRRAVYARRINESGVVVGHVECWTSTGDPEAPYLPRGARAFRWSAAAGAEALQSIDPTATDVVARGINDQGVVVGFEWPANGDSTANLWQPGGGVAPAFTPAPSFCWQFARAEDVNNQGAIAASDVREYGSYCDSIWLLKLPTGEEILGPAGGGALPYGINNNNVLVGMAEHDAVRWSPQSGAVVLHDSAEPFEIAYAYAVNDHDESVGYAFTYEAENACTTAQEAKWWTADGVEHSLPGLPGSVMSSAYDINERSDIVGGVQLDPPACQEVNLIGSRAVLWRDGQPHDLNAALPNSFSRQYQLTFAAAINDRGHIVARAIKRDEPKAACPIWEWDPETYSEFYDADRLCHVEYAFLLTPVK